MLRCLSLALLFLWSCPGYAEKRNYRLEPHTEPPKAWVYLIVPGKKAVENDPAQQYAPADFKLRPGDLLGQADGEPLITRPLPEDQGSISLVLLQSHCQPLVVQVDLTALTSSGSYSLPVGGGVYQLTYASGKARWREWGGRYLLPAVVGVFGLTGLAFLVPIYLDRLRNREQSLAAREFKAMVVTDLVVPSSTEDPLIGSRLDDYRILQQIGQGGMARVYRGVPDATLDESQAVAIKIMNHEMAKTPELIERFDRERRVYESLNHPHIVKVFAAGEQVGHYYMVMELIRGHSLRQEVESNGVSPKKMLRLMTPVFEAVAYAHKKGVVHRDLKPENVMLSHDDQIKVMDFGLAKTHDLPQVTATGSVLGTPAYIAPEQINGELHPASDQYALGVMCWEFLTGRRPFEDENPVTLIVKHLSEPVPSLAERRPDLARFAKVLERMLAKKPEDRFRDLEHALTSLRYTG
ncbi:MAG: serine/threonine protein kinase [Candidatus Eremiobacteraeota bacterium]|nr:serine/threonine protein kinase [Candidatus Eremiobacteraeota bacterium]